MRWERLILRCAVISLAALLLGAFTAGTPITTDSRIKTFVYNENDVYRLLTHYGYQLNIEFGKKELIQTISVGDRAGWQIVPNGRRLFVRAMQDKAHTNMTVVTNKRAYQFDLYSAQPDNKGWDELVYVVRFYYADEQEPASPNRTAFSPTGSTGPMQFPSSPPSVAPPMMGPAAINPGMPANPYGQQQMMPMQPAYAPPMMPMPAAQPYPMMPPPVQGFGGGGSVLPPQRYGQNNVMRRAPMGANPYAGMAPAAGGQGMDQLLPLDAPLNYNYNYSFTGEQSLLPSQMFDDGQHTFLLFPEDKAKPELYVVTEDGKERQVPLSRNNQFLTAPGIYARMTLRKGPLHACIYNEMKAQI